MENNFIENISKVSTDRISFWKNLIENKKISSIAEIGVYKGDFAKIMIGIESVSKYYMIDPWINLDDWNKPFNKDNETFSKFYNETIKVTDYAKEKRVILRGKTSEKIDNIKNKTLDLIYVDGDHTLKGITIDLIMSWPKIKPNGLLGGDDLSPSIWQHNQKYEPSMVFPFAVYFAESVKCPIYLLPNNQFIIIKNLKGFKVFDLTGKYNDTGILNQLLKFNKLKNRRGLYRFFK